MNGFVVEMCGLPGSGKTTVARNLQHALRAAGAECLIADGGVSAQVSPAVRVVRRSAYAARASIRRPRPAVTVAGLVHATGQNGPRDTIAVLAQWLATSELVSRSHRRSGVHVFEEGMVQTMWTLLLRSAFDPVDRLWGEVPARAQSDLVVALKAPPVLAASRLSRRTSLHSRTQLLPQELRVEELERGGALMERILELCPVPVLRLHVELGVGPDELGYHIAHRVLEQVARPARP